MKIRFRSFARDQLLKASHKLRCHWPPINIEHWTLGGPARKKEDEVYYQLCTSQMCRTHCADAQMCNTCACETGRRKLYKASFNDCSLVINLIIRLHLSLRKCAKMRREIRNTWWCLLKVYFSQFHICVLIVLSVWVSDLNTVITF